MPEERTRDLEDKPRAPALGATATLKGKSRTDPLVAPREVQVARSGFEVEGHVSESLGCVDDDKPRGSGGGEFSHNPSQGQAYAIVRDLREEEPIRGGPAVASGEALDQLASFGSIAEKNFTGRHADQSPAHAPGLGPEDLEVGRPFEVGVQDDAAAPAEEVGSKLHQWSGMG